MKSLIVEKSLIEEILFNGLVISHWKQEIKVKLSCEENHKQNGRKSHRLVSRKIASNGEVEKVSHLVVAHKKAKTADEEKKIIENVLTSKKAKNNG